MKPRTSPSRRKSDLPWKICEHCRRPMAWRKKWAQVWEEVKYCSERCRRAPPDTPPDTPPNVPAPGEPPARSRRGACP